MGSPRAGLVVGALGSGCDVPDLVESFFEELGRRGHDPLLDRVSSTGLFEVHDGERTDAWLVKVQGGYIAVSQGAGDADWVIHVDRKVLNQVITGEEGSLPAFIRGTLALKIKDQSARFFLLTRLFAGRRESRG
jgi:hypothetical protein